MSISREPHAHQEEYFQLLRATGSLSRLFSTNNKPYLNYRCHENIFCKAFGASNESRADIAVDAVLLEHSNMNSSIGVGLKTFVCEESTFTKGSQRFEKIAEFNKLFQQYRYRNDKDLVACVSRARNERLGFAERSCGIGSSIYHCVARLPGKFLIYETDMVEVDVGSIEILKSANDNVINFKSGDTSYKFNRTKSTLFRAFTLDHIIRELPIEIVEDPYEVLVGLQTEPIPIQQVTREIVLPLYSTKGRQKIVHPKSGLNQWNAAGRPRALEEVYIPIPSYIRTRFANFFPDRNQPFDIYLPDGEELSVKVCQDNGKALMSNPNVALGLWLLRRVLNLAEGEILTYDRLLQVGIDAVSLSCDYESGHYSIGFRPIGFYERFRAKYPT